MKRGGGLLLLVVVTTWACSSKSTTPRPPDRSTPVKAVVANPDAGTKKSTRDPIYDQFYCKACTEAKSATVLPVNVRAAFGQVAKLAALNKDNDPFRFVALDIGKQKLWALLVPTKWGYAALYISNRTDPLAVSECGADDGRVTRMSTVDLTGDKQHELVLETFGRWHGGGEGAHCVVAFEWRQGKAHQILDAVVATYEAERQGGAGFEADALRFVRPGVLQHETSKNQWIYDKQQHKFTCAKCKN